MKTVIASIVSLVVGLWVGWRLEQLMANRQKADIVQQMVGSGEASDREHAVRAVRAIQLIESGEPQRAVQLLSSPVAHYYTLYTGAGTKQERRAETRALIEQLAKTNQVVATRIAELATNLQSNAP